MNVILSYWNIPTDGITDKSTKALIDNFNNIMNNFTPYVIFGILAIVVIASIVSILRSGIALASNKTPEALTLFKKRILISILVVSATALLITITPYIIRIVAEHTITQNATQ